MLHFPGVCQHVDSGRQCQYDTYVIGMTPMEIAESWADPRVLEIVREKWDALPPIDKKKAAKGKGKKIGGTKGKRPTTAPGQNGILQVSQ